MTRAGAPGLCILGLQLQTATNDAGQFTHMRGRLTHTPGRLAQIVSYL